MGGKVNLVLLLLVALAGVCSAAHLYPSDYIRSVLNRRNSDQSVECVAHVFELLGANEECHDCAYDHKMGYRAVAAGYNMDDEKEMRMKEMKMMGLDYDQVRDGKQCLNKMQMTMCTIMDAMRALEKAKMHVGKEDMSKFCCRVQAVFADITHSMGYMDEFPKKDMEKTIKMAMKDEYRSAAHELERTDWCSKMGKRCTMNRNIMHAGC